MVENITNKVAEETDKLDERLFGNIVLYWEKVEKVWEKEYFDNVKTYPISKDDNLYILEFSCSAWHGKKENLKIWETKFLQMPEDWLEEKMTYYFDWKNFYEVSYKDINSLKNVIGKIKECKYMMSVCVDELWNMCERWTQFDSQKLLSNILKKEKELEAYLNDYSEILIEWKKVAKKEMENKILEEFWGLKPYWSKFDPKKAQNQISGLFTL